MRTQAVIIGAGPAGLLLGRLLDLSGIDNVLLERQTREHVLSRIRAGILEQTTVDLLKSAEAGDRVARRVIPHHAVQLAFDYQSVAIELSRHTGGKVVTTMARPRSPAICVMREAAGHQAIYQADAVELFDFDTDSPYVTYRRTVLNTGLIAI